MSKKNDQVEKNPTPDFVVLGDVLGEVVPEVRNAFWRKRVSLDFSKEEVITKQSMRDLCDINLIMKRWMKTGVLDHVNLQKPMYGDFSNADDYLGAMLQVKQAEADFAALPAHIRDVCDNDPSKFLDLISNPENKAQLEELGLGEVYEALHGPGDAEAPGGAGPASDASLPNEVPATPEVPAQEQRGPEGPPSEPAK